MKSHDHNSRILTTADVSALAKAVRVVIGPDVSKLALTLGVQAEEIIRFQSVAEQCTRARESRGSTFKDRAEILRVPQYRLKAIERSSLGEIRGEILAHYAEVLEIDQSLYKWVAANAALATKLNLKPRRIRAITKRNGNND